MTFPYDDDYYEGNESNNEHFEIVLARALANPSRRGLLKGGLGLASLMAMPLSSWASDSISIPSAGVASQTLGFNATAKSLADQVMVPEGYVVKVLHATGDPIDQTVPAYSNAGTESDDWSHRIGDHHDGMEIFYIDANGKYSPTATQRAVLVVNHESSADAHFFNLNGQTSNGVSGQKFTQFGNWNVGQRPGQEVMKEINQHGFSIVELDLDNNGSIKGYKIGAPLNRRVTPMTVAQVQGPAAHLADIQTFMQTQYDPSGQTVRGTLNNCANGLTPWGTYLGCEENWATYFNIPTNDSAPESKLAVSNKRYGLPTSPIAADAKKARGQGWFTVTDMPDDAGRFARWNLSPKAASATQDFRNEGNTFGYVVEVDPANPQSVPAKRVALGRMAHEGAVCSNPVAGQPLAFYMGCDSRNEYIYKFVSAQNWNPADVGGGMAAGNKYLNEGKLYAAKFNDDGQGEWLELSIEDPRIKNYAPYAFANQADVFINARSAADAVGATKMDRPEWGAINPKNGEVYFTLTNNNSKNRQPGTVNAANPRAYADADGKKSSGNPNGHIIRFKEVNNVATAKGFNWDIFLFGAEEDMPKDVNISGLTASNSFSSPDGVRFSPTTGIMWIETDDGAATDETNCMLLAALPGNVGDGAKVSVQNNLGDKQGNQQTFVGAILGDARLKRFLVAPKGAEVTGLTETADGKTLLVNIQHPGENTKALEQGPEYKFESQWPATAQGSQQYGPGQRPRSATLIITKLDGGLIGM
jgi:secreted PhoX family phosphatase